MNRGSSGFADPDRVFNAVWSRLLGPAPEPPPVAVVSLHDVLPLDPLEDLELTLAVLRDLEASDPLHK